MAVCVWTACFCRIWAQAPPSPSLTFTNTNTQKKAGWAPYPAAEAYTILWTTDLNLPFVTNASGSLTGFTWQSTSTAPAGFYRLQVSPLSRTPITRHSVTRLFRTSNALISSSNGARIQSFEMMQ